MGNLGPSATVNPPDWELADNNLLAVAQAPVDPPGTRWQIGLQFVPDPCGSGGTWVPCTDADNPEPGENPGIIDYTPVQIVAAYKCGTFGMGDENGAIYQGKAKSKLEANRSKLVEAELWSGAAARADALPNLWIAPTPQDIIDYSGPGERFANFVDLNPAGGGIAVSVAYAELLGALASCAGIKGTIHLPFRSASILYGSGTIGYRGNRLTDVMGNTIVVGTGYDGSQGPTAVTSGAGGTEWIYATGPVMVRLDQLEVAPDSIGEALERGSNDATFYASRLMAATWDDCCHFGIEASLSGSIDGGTP